MSNLRTFGATAMTLALRALRTSGGAGAAEALKVALAPLQASLSGIRCADPLAAAADYTGASQAPRALPAGDHVAQ